MKNSVIKALKDLGCQPEINKTNDITFKYQGEYFVIQILSKRIIRIGDFWWYELKLDDPKLEYLKEAINFTNINGPVTVLYSINQEESILGVHCMCQTGFFEEVSDIKDYLAYLLNDCFRAQQEVKERVTALINKEQIANTTNERVKIKGFK